MKKINLGITLVLLAIYTSIMSSMLWICINKTMYKLDVPTGIMAKIMDGLFIMAGPGALYLSGLGIAIMIHKFIKGKIPSFRQKKSNVLLKVIEA